MNAACRVLCVPRARPDLAAHFHTDTCASLEDAAARLRDSPQDAVLIDLAAADVAGLAAWPALTQAVLDAAVIVVADVPDEQALAWLQRGVQDVLPPGADAARALRLAIERKRLEQAARKAYATDLATGLPNHAQLLEHMTHLLALREREPAPMAMIVLRVEGLQRTADTLGAEAANVLRRKVAVRLRAALRASDVVASIGSDAFAVLLAWIDSPRDGERVTQKMAESLAQPFSVTGRRLTLAVSAGLASYPEHGKDADTLLRRALGQAAQMATIGSEGLASRFDRGPGAAANDDEL